MDAQPQTGGLHRDVAHEGVDPVAYLDAVTATDFAKGYKRLTYDVLGARPGATLLDVGCGTGDDVLEMARLCGPTGRASGVDRNPHMIAEAWKRLRASGLSADFQLADAARLPFPDDTFDGVRVDRVLQHLPQPLRALEQMVRVARPGGRIVATEPDWETFVVDCEAARVTRSVAQYMAMRSVQSGCIGRQLFRLMRGLGLREVQIRAMPLVLTDLPTADHIWGLRRHAREAVCAGLFPEADRAEWERQLEAAHRAGEFFSSACGFMVSGVKAGGPGR